MLTSCNLLFLQQQQQVLEEVLARNKKEQKNQGGSGSCQPSKYHILPTDPQRPGSHPLGPWATSYSSVVRRGSEYEVVLSSLGLSPPQDWGSFLQEALLTAL